ncbi:kinesin-like protein KIF2A isoform X3 [Convolutriloba macropyga]|uniref:kinesin-like protein KIF2A isoform X3 n=1 Tax=Convolutriloba macropyga TaxID=536237 RepID=UPI003F52818D
MAMSDRSSPITSPNSNRGIGPSFYGSQTRPWRSKTLPPRYQIPGRSAERTVSPTRVRQDKQKIPTTRRTGAMNKRGISRPNSVVYTEEEQQDVVAPPPVPVRGVAAVNNTIQNASSADQNTSNLPQKKILPGGGSLTVLQQQPPTQPPPPAQNTNTLNNVQSQQNNKDAANVRRKSNCVKEVERMEKEREQRRVNQQKKRDEKEQIMNKLNNDGNNPNWEFYKMIIEFQESLQYNPLQGNEAVADHQICVAVRKRPMSVKEKKKSEVDVLTIPDKQTLIVHEPKVKVDLTKFLENQTFRFDYSFDENVDNRMVYKYTAQPLVRSIFDGGMATCFAYGQTGSGKTHTMGGDFTGKTQDSTKGIYAYAAQDVFKLLESPKYAGLNLLVSCSFFEIYSAKVFDLINEKKRLQVLEDGKAEVHVKGLMEVVVNSVEDIMQLIHLGNSTRTSGTTSMNNHSSRSHAVFQIILRPSNQTSKLHGKLSLIDLAGNERGKDTISSDRGTRLEGAEINKSLLALKECIRALGKPGAHLPFRSSKLTQVLRDSFIGDNARTCMIAMIAPVFSSCEHTLNTLRYADRVKELGATDTAIMEEAELEVYDPDDPLNSPSPSRNGTGNPQEHGGKKGGDASKKRRSHNSSMGLLRNEDVEAKMMRTQDDEEIQEDWYAVMPLCDELREMEEKLLDNVRAHIENEMELSEQKRNLYNGTNNPDYDIDDFSAQMERMVDGQLDELLKIKEDLANIRLKIKQEEETAKQITTKKQSGKK